MPDAIPRVTLGISAALRLHCGTPGFTVWLLEADVDELKSAVIEAQEDLQRERTQAERVLEQSHVRYEASTPAPCSLLPALAPCCLYGVTSLDPGEGCVLLCLVPVDVLGAGAAAGAEAGTGAFGVGRSQEP